MQHLPSNKRKIAESVMNTNRMFVLLGEAVGKVLLSETSGKTSEEKCLNIDVTDKTELWHHQYGHLSHNGLLTLCNKEIVVGLPAIGKATVTCESCMKGKQHRISFPKHSNWKATEKLQLIHSDLCGPITPPSNSGMRYLIVSLMISLGRPGYTLH